MSDQVIKTNQEVKDQMYRWFLHYFRKPIDEFKGTEEFTFFDKIREELKIYLLERIKLADEELPVFVLKTYQEEFIVNTTARFIHLTKTKTENIYYKDFEYHDGFKSLKSLKSEYDGKEEFIKKDGYIGEFGLKEKNKEIVFWKVPTGLPAFAFWNVTKKFELIGRKYIIRKN